MVRVGKGLFQQTFKYTSLNLVLYSLAAGVAFDI